MNITNVGENIRKVRKSKKMTLQEVGEKIGLKSSAVSKYESGAVSPTIAMLIEISAALEVDVFELLIGTSFENLQKDIMEHVTDLVNDIIELKTDCLLRFDKIYCDVSKSPQYIFTGASHRFIDEETAKHAKEDALR